MRTVRPFSAVLRAAVLLALAAAAPLPAHAQAAVTPAPNLPSAPVSALSVASPLAIPMPAGATVQVEMNLSDDDLLGVFKSFLRGISEGAYAIPAAVKTSSPPNSPNDTGAQVAQIISNADLSDIMKGVSHIRFVLLQTGGTPPLPFKIVPHPMGKHAVTHVAPPVFLPDQTGFYETAFAGEGGHRLLYSNFAPVHVLMTSFGHARGFALMTQYPGGIVVMRADGYPDLSKLSSLATQIGAAAAKAGMQNRRPNYPDGK